VFALDTSHPPLLIATALLINVWIIRINEQQSLAGIIQVRDRARWDYYRAVTSLTGSGGNTAIKPGEMPGENIDMTNTTLKK
jgi:hypothetical protein